jgi:hypothetical protein
MRKKEEKKLKFFLCAAAQPERIVRFWGGMSQKCLLFKPVLALTPARAVAILEASNCLRG